MKRRLVVLLTGPLACLFLITSAHAENSVVVESRVFKGGQAACTVGVFFTNEIPIEAIILPLELREVTPGSYIAPTPDANSGFVSEVTPGKRWYQSPVSVTYVPSANATWKKYAATAAPDCGGPISHSFNIAVAQVDYLSPDAIFHGAVSTGDPGIGDSVNMEPGSDPPGTANASYRFIFGVTRSPGYLEIDTCCVRPDNHLRFGYGGGFALAPSFTKGTIAISCHADPLCNGVQDVVDVVMVVNRAFRGASATLDPTCAAHGVTVDGRTDVDCSGTTDILDVVKMADVAFRGANASTVFCEPCGP